MLFFIYNLPVKVLLPYPQATTHTNTREVNIINSLMDSAHLVTEPIGMQNSVIANAQLF